MEEVNSWHLQVIDTRASGMSCHALSLGDYNHADNNQPSLHMFKVASFPGLPTVQFLIARSM